MALTTVDTSVLVAGLQRWHPMHVAAFEVLRRADLRVGGHVLAETYSTLTGGVARPRLPAADVALALARFGEPLILSAAGYVALLRRLAERGSVGGAIYDAVVGATAREANAHLVSLDRRAARTYEVVGVDYELIGAPAS